MLSRHPYMLRALYEWLVDSGDVPHLLVDAERDEVQVPRQFVQDGRIVLNVGPEAVQNLTLGNDYIMFSARFGGRPMDVVLPQESVIAIYGRDSGEGMMFNLDDVELEVPEDAAPGDRLNENSESDTESPEIKALKRKGKPDLKVIK